MKVAVIAFLLTFSLIYGYQKITEPDYQQCSVAYTVKDGDTLWQVAAEHMPMQDKHDDVRGLLYDIQTVNGIPDKDARWLSPGRTLVIPLATEK